MSNAYYLVEDGHATGPHSLAVLRQKAELRVIKPESLVCSIAVAAEDGEPPRPPASAYRYRRRRDYLWCAGALNAFCFAYGAASTFLNPFLIALFVIGNLALLWVLFAVMDRY